MKTGEILNRYLPAQHPNDMNEISLVSSVILALGVLNVWLLRPSKATPWRGGQAQTLREEFSVYGLPHWFMITVGLVKVTLALLLVAGMWLPQIGQLAAMTLGALMLGAIAMHLRAHDPLRKSLPAITMLSLTVLSALR